MLDLYEETFTQIRVYYRRQPKADGGNPNANKLGIAAGILILLGMAATNLLDFSFRDSGVYYKWAALGLIAGYLIYWIATQFFQLIFCSRTRSLYVSYIFFKRRLARFDDIGEIRIRLMESGGILYGFYVALWRGDPLRKPLNLSPKGKTQSQIAHYRHSIMPKVRLMIWGDLGENVPTEVTTSTVSTQPGGVPGDTEPMAGLRKKELPAKPPPLPKKGYDKIFCLDVFLELLAGLAIIAAVAIIFAYAGIPQREMQGRVHDAILMLFLFLVLKFAAYGACIVAAWRLIKRVARRNIDIRIDPVSKQIYFRNIFGLQKNTFTFESVIELTIKYRRGRQYLCLVLENQYADPVVYIGCATASTRQQINKVCELMDLDPRIWVDVLYPVRRYSESYQRRILQTFNPYYEK